MSILRGFADELVKLAKDEAKEERHTGRNLALAGVGAAPMAGAIGQKPIIHDPVTNPSIPRTRSAKDLARMAQPGDVLVTSKPKGSIWKTFISPLSGSHFYHTEPVVARKGGRGTTASAGEFEGREWRHATTRDTDPIDATMHNEYPDAVLLRPNKALSPGERKAFQHEAMRRSKAPYDSRKAVSVWLKDLFVPKLGDHSKAKAPPVCEGNVCSTLPAMAHAKAGRSVIPGKAPHNLMPTDYLRSPEFKPVAARVASGYKSHPFLQKAMPYLTRAAIGGALAGTGYLAARGIEHFRHRNDDAKKG